MSGIQHRENGGISRLKTQIRTVVERPNGWFSAFFSLQPTAVQLLSCNLWLIPVSILFNDAVCSFFFSLSTSKFLKIIGTEWLCSAPSVVVGTCVLLVVMSALL